MRTTLDLDPDLLQQAMGERRATSKTAVVQMGLEGLLAIEARFGKVTTLEKTPRRRAED